MNDPIIRLLFLAHLGSSLYMVGLIWFVQVVHYPLFDSVGDREFPSYEQRHTAECPGVVPLDGYSAIGSHLVVDGLRSGSLPRSFVA